MSIRHLPLKAGIALLLIGGLSGCTAVNAVESSISETQGVEDAHVWLSSDGFMTSQTLNIRIYVAAEKDLMAALDTSLEAAFDSVGIMPVNGVAVDALVGVPGADPEREIGRQRLSLVDAVDDAGLDADGMTLAVNGRVLMLTPEAMGLRY